MKRNENQKEKNTDEEKWHARMDEIEAIWQNRMEEGRMEYRENFMQESTDRTTQERVSLNNHVERRN